MLSQADKIVLKQYPIYLTKNSVRIVFHSLEWARTTHLSYSCFLDCRSSALCQFQAGQEGILDGGRNSGNLHCWILSPCRATRHSLLCQQNNQQTGEKHPYPGDGCPRLQGAYGDWPALAGCRNRSLTTNACMGTQAAQNWAIRIQ